MSPSNQTQAKQLTAEDRAISKRFCLFLDADQRDAFQVRLRNSVGAAQSVRLEINQGLYIPGAHWSA